MSPAGSNAETCYRHPDRESWTLCQRCGRTICPECQILTPAGVRCPECVRELGGSVQWTPVSSAQRAKREKATATREPRGSSAGSRFVSGLLRPGGTTPTVTWTIAGLSVIAFVVALFTANAPFVYLAAYPGAEWQIWRYFTSPLGTLAALDFGVILGFALNLFFFMIVSPGIEQSLSRNRYLAVFFAGTAVGSAAMVISGGYAAGLTAPLFGFLGAILVVVWSNPPVRTQFLIVLAINFVVTLVLSPAFLPQIIGGLLGGLGAILLFRFFDDRTRSRPSAPYLAIAGGVAVFIAIAIVRGLIR